MGEPPEVRLGESRAERATSFSLFLPSDRSVRSRGWAPTQLHASIDWPRGCCQRGDAPFLERAVSGRVVLAAQARGGSRQADHKSAERGDPLGTVRAIRVTPRPFSAAGLRE